MAEYLPRIEMDTSYETFMAVSNAGNPHPEIIGEHGIRVSRFYDDYIVKYVDADKYSFASPAIYRSSQPSKKKSGSPLYDYDETPTHWKTPSAESEYWFSADKYWTDAIVPEVVDSASNPDYGHNNKVILLAVELAVPYAHPDVPMHGIMGVLGGDRIVDVESAFSAILQSAREAGEAGDWKTACGLKDVLLTSTMRSAGKAALNFGSFRDWYYSPGGVSTQVTGLNYKQLETFEAFEMQKEHIGQHFAGGIAIDATTTAPFLRAIEVSTSGKEDDEVTIKLQTVQKKHVDRVRYRIGTAQPCHDAFTQAKNLPHIDLIPAISTFAGQDLTKYYGNI